MQLPVVRGGSDIIEQSGRADWTNQIQIAERRAQLQRLGQAIEELRHRLYRLAGRGSDKELQQINEELDRLILEFTRMARGS